MFTAGVLFAGVVGDTVGGVVRDRLLRKTGSLVLARRSVIVVGFLGAFVFLIIVDYFHAIQTGLDVIPGQFGATYAIPIIYVPLLMITHVVAFYFLLRPQKEDRYV